MSWTGRTGEGRFSNTDLFIAPSIPQCTACDNMSLLTADVVPMQDSSHVAGPARVDCIYNRTRGRNLKDLQRSPLRGRPDHLAFPTRDQIAVPTRDHITSPVRDESTNYRGFRQDQLPLRPIPFYPSRSSGAALIDSKKASFEAYLQRRNPGNTTRNQLPSRPQLQYQLTDPGSAPPVLPDTSSSSSSSAPYIRSSSVPSAPELLAPPDPHRHLRGALNYQPNKGPKVSVLLANPSSSSPGIRLTTASPPAVRHRLRSMDSHDSGYGNSPGKVLLQTTFLLWLLSKSTFLNTPKNRSLVLAPSFFLVFLKVWHKKQLYPQSIDKMDSMEMSEIEAEYYKTIPRRLSPTNIPLYVNKLSELFSTKRNFEAFLRSEFKYVAVASGNSISSVYFPYFLRLVPVNDHKYHRNVCNCTICNAAADLRPFFSRNCNRAKGLLIFRWVSRLTVTYYLAFV